MYLGIDFSRFIMYIILEVLNIRTLDIQNFCI